MLGSGKRTVDKLREAGLLTVVPDPGDPEGILYPVEGVRALLQDLEGRIAPAPGDRKDRARIRPKRPVTMAGITRRVPRPDFDLCDVIKAVHAGSITPAALAPRARGLHRLLFRSSDADRFVAAAIPKGFSATLKRCRRAGFTPTAGRTLSVVEAAAELGVKQEVGYHWVRVGLLATVAVDSPMETGRRVTEAALAAFRQEYVTGAEFARLHRLGRKWAATHLVQAGVQAVSGPSVDGARQFLFRRADLEGSDASRLVSGRSKLRPEAARARLLDRAGSEGFKYAVGRALKREFGDGLVRRYHSYRDEATGTVIQVMTAGNRGTTGKYEFLISTKHRLEVGAAERGFLALGFSDRTDFLLVPWQEVDPLFGSMPSHDTPHGRVWRLGIKGDAAGRLTLFGEHSQQMRPEVC